MPKAPTRMPATKPFRWNSMGGFTTGMLCLIPAGYALRAGPFQTAAFGMNCLMHSAGSNRLALRLNQTMAGLYLGPEPTPVVSAVCLVGTG